MGVQECSDAGELKPCTIMLDRHITALMIQRPRTKHSRRQSILLENIQDVSSVQRPPGEDMLVANCARVVPGDGSAVQLCFSDEEERDRFVYLMSNLVDGRRKEIQAQT